MIVPRDPFEPITAAMWEELRAAWPDGGRLRVAWRLARTLDQLERLLAGDAIDLDDLDADAVEYAMSRRLVRLERPIDQFASERLA